MSKKKRHRNRHLGSQATIDLAPTPQDPITSIKAAHEEAMSVMTDQDLSGSTSQPLPPDHTPEALWKLVQEAQNIFRGATDRANGSAAEAEKLRQECAAKLTTAVDLEAKLGAQEQELAKRADEIRKRELEADGKEASFTERESSLRQRELNAQAGFDKENQKSLEVLSQSKESLQREIDQLEKRLVDRRLSADKEAEEARRQLGIDLEAERIKATNEITAKFADAEASFQERERAIVAREDEVSKVHRLQETKARELENHEADIKEYRAHLKQRAEELAAGIREELEHKVRALEDQLESARKDRDTHEATLRSRSDADRRFGQKTPDEVLREIDALRSERETLKKTIAERPDATAAARLQDLEKQREGWEAERIELNRKVTELERRLSNSTIAAIQLETLRDHKAALESGRSVLQQAVTELRSEVDSLISRSDAKATFPALAAMDADRELQRAMPLYESIGDLAIFAEDVRQRIAKNGLFYSSQDTRSFLGGLAMGPLVLLQGISGTGKTSLPIAFAQAMGTEVEPIEVQAGWRDPQDLVGHYNAFEKRFYEKEFLKALYRAQTPRWRDTLQIILLDEMNLSHPEQYFSDMLSALERTHLRRLVLMTHPIDHPPQLLKEGSWLPIPENVWFVGTANHDETTKDFADKTYDRSHVMQFPHAPEPFIPKVASPRHPVSFKALQRAFGLAKVKHAPLSDACLSFLRSHLRKPLAEHFEVGWGPRLEKQLKDYVPVVVAAGGTVGEATDHVLGMRLLRKLRNRHDNRPEQVKSLSQLIQDKWSILDEKSKPVKSLELLRAELQRLGHVT